MQPSGETTGVISSLASCQLNEDEDDKDQCVTHCHRETSCPPGATTMVGPQHSPTSDSGPCATQVFSASAARLQAQPGSSAATLVPCAELSGGAPAAQPKQRAALPGPPLTTSLHQRPHPQQSQPRGFGQGPDASGLTTAAACGPPSLHAVCLGTCSRRCRSPRHPSPLLA